MSTSVNLPYECPECGNDPVVVSEVPPDNHDRGETFVTRVRCPNCEYVDWYD
jgi:predicted RNA-binding Zn-ribbon protein involved in translation (DUF1610 family)